jgi:hypothetical protein
MKTLKYAWRFLMRSKSYTIINLLGLAFSLACCIILMRYIHRELTVDAHCIDPEHIVIPLRDIEGNVHPGNMQDADTAYVNNDYIVEQCHIVLEQQDNVIYEEKNYVMNVLAVDSTFFHFFAYPLLTGNSHLDAPEAALITRRCAERMFGKENPLGKTLGYSGKNVVIQGVIDEPDCKTILQFDLLVSHQLHKNWQRMDMQMMRLLPSVNINAINIVSNVYKRTEYGALCRWKFINWQDFYFDNSIKNDQYDYCLKFGNRTHLHILSGVALLLLLVGILNFINIYMVFMMKRSKEYGVKKVFGLHKLPLFLQIWMENFVLAAIALFVAWLLIEVVQIPVNRLMHDDITYSSFDWKLSLGFIVLLPFLTSIYPYIKYNYMPPVVSIRSIATSRHSTITRMSFLFVQYIITILLIILSLYFNKHLNFLLHTPPGYRTENILLADLQHESKNHLVSKSEEEEKALYQRKDRIEQILNECPHIEMWMNSHYSILGGGSTSNLLNDKGQQLSVQILFPSSKFFQLYDLKVLDGEIPKQFDNWMDMKMVLNKSAMKAFGYTHREEAFVRSESPLWVSVVNGERVDGGTKLMPVVAVIDDYYPGHLTEGLKPMAFVVGRETNSGKYLISVKRGKEKEVIDYLKQKEKEIYSTEDFTYSWLKDDIKELYIKDRQVMTIYSVFAMIAIVISCLGLFGLSLFDIRQRYREIAIRKVNGASMRDLYLLLFRKYVVVLGGAFVVAMPFSFYFLYVYTRNFVVKAPIGVGIYLVALLVVLLISLGTLLWQIRKAANIDPAKIIKSE